MLFLLFINYALATQSQDYAQFNSSMMTAIKYGQFMQIIPNTFGMGSNIQTPIDGKATVNLTISSMMKNMFDFFIFDTPYNEFYVCYIHLSERSGEFCKQLVQDLCIPCPKNSTYLSVLVSMFIQAVMSVQLNYQNKTQQATNMNSLCFLGCESDNIGSFIIQNVSYGEYQNTASYMIIDNTPFPDLSDCNIQIENCEDLNSTINPTSPNLQHFCESVRPISCVQKFQNVTKPEIQFNIDFNILVKPNNYPYYVQYMVMIILVIIIIFLFIILCVVAMRFKRVKKQKLLLMKKKK